MEIWTARVLTHLVFVLFLLPLCHSLPLVSKSPVCQIPSLQGSIIVEGNQCTIDYDNDQKFFVKRGVFQVNGTDLERSLLVLNSREGMHAAVLVYARWCPFSRALLPLFDTLSSSFPSIYHFAVEESALQRSAFSYYGVNSFPVLFLHNKTAKFRYQGKRTYDAVTKFYKECSGLTPISTQYRREDKEISLKVGEPELSTSLPGGGNLHDDVYLILSFVFLISRGLLYLLPKLSNIIKQYWAHKHVSWQAYWNLLHRFFFSKFQPKRGMQHVSKAFKGKNPKMVDFTQERGKVLLSMPGWPSSSLSAVSLAEGSGS